MTYRSAARPLVFARPNKRSKTRVRRPRCRRRRNRRMGGAQPARPAPTQTPPPSQARPQGLNQSHPPSPPAGAPIAMSDDPQDDIVSSHGEILLYPTEDGQCRVECRLASDTLWLSQAAMVELYQSSKANISLHLKNVFEEGELGESSCQAILDNCSRRKALPGESLSPRCRAGCRLPGTIAPRNAVSAVGDGAPGRGPFALNTRRRGPSRCRRSSPSCPAPASPW